MLSRFFRQNLRKLPVKFVANAEFLCYNGGYFTERFLPMLKKYLLCALVSMVPLIELRGGVPIAVGMGLNYPTALVVCAVANMMPVPII